MCIDYRELHKLTTKNLPRVDDLFNQLKGEVSKVENGTAEMLCHLDQLMENKEDGGMYFIWVPLNVDVRTLIMDEAHASRNELFKAMQSMFEEYRQQEQAANLSTHTSEPSRRFNSICYEDYDDDERTIPLHLDDSLIMGNEDLITIPKKESDEFITSSVEDLDPIPSESGDTSESDRELTILFEENISKDSSKEFTSLELNDFPFLLPDCDSSFSEEFFEIVLLVSFPSRNKDKDFPDFEESRARGFVHRPLKLLSLACLYIWESDILDLIDLTFNL
nr:hypothetical protein [Tanacetum cinerariifolium]